MTTENGEAILLCSTAAGQLLRTRTVVYGTLSLTRDELVWRQKAYWLYRFAGFGLLRWVRSVIVPIRDIVSIEHQRKFLGAQLLIVTKTDTIALKLGRGPLLLGANSRAKVWHETLTQLIARTSQS